MMQETDDGDNDDDDDDSRAEEAIKDEGGAENGQRGLSLSPTSREVSPKQETTQKTSKLFFPFNFSFCLIFFYCSLDFPYFFSYIFTFFFYILFFRYLFFMTKIVAGYNGPGTH